MTIRLAAETPWYDLFSRGARDWLRHDEKVREAVRANLPEIYRRFVTNTNRAGRNPVRVIRGR